MKKYPQYFVLLLTLALFITACNTTVTQVGPKYSPTWAGQVEVLYQNPDKPFEVLALITRRGLPGDTVQDVTRQCVDLAAEVGADALLVTSAVGYTWTSNPTVEGKAIKYK